jgi:hypothetical protein
MDTLSPMANPERDISNWLSKWLEPITFIPAMVYSTGVRFWLMAFNAGSTEVPVVSSWARAGRKDETSKEKITIRRISCITRVLGRQNTAYYENCLLKTVWAIC